ncbi:hypothetical protein M9Y10_016602 [Tritrichomonas musculus]|uniref:Uncharacterized protein n=1 Tax=Tritrichomonas musculus TaxID=1915356 RepID=A0ABR2HXL5_9EUKA
MSDLEIAGNHFKVSCYSEIISPSDINQYLKENHPDICLVDAKLITSIRQIKTAVINTLALQKSDQMQCKSINLELLRCFSPDGRLNSAFKFCAITETTKSAIGIILDASKAIPDVPGLGSQVPLNEFFDNHQPDYELINKLYMITDDMRKIYSYEDIICTTLSIVSSDLVRTHST